MNENLFRKSSIDRVSSPEQLNKYIRVAQPSVWVTLGAIIILLLGAVIWGVFGTIETTVDTGVVVKNGAATCYVDSDAMKTLSPGMTITVGNAQGTIQAIAQVPTPVPDDRYVRYYGSLEADELCYEVEVTVPGLSDGVYAGSVLVDSIHPLTFVIH